MACVTRSGLAEDQAKWRKTRYTILTDCFQWFCIFYTGKVEAMELVRIVALKSDFNVALQLGLKPRQSNFENICVDTEVANLLKTSYDS